MRTSRRFMTAVAVLFAAVSAHAQTITYQGQLKNGATTASGLYDLRFTLMSASTGGAQVDQVCVDNVQVTGGLFTVQLPFTHATAALQLGSPLFLSIEVRPDSGQACGTGAGYTLLAPRQALTQVPSAAVADYALNFAGGQPVYAELKRSTTLAVPGNGGTSAGAAIPFDAVIANTGGAALFDAAQPTRILAPQTGRYLVNLRLGGAASAAVTHGVRLRKNSDLTLANEIVLGAGSSDLATVSTVGGQRPDNFTTVVSLTQGEYFEVWISGHNSSGTQANASVSEAVLNVQLLGVGPQGPMGPQGAPGAPGPSYTAGSGLALAGTTFSIPPSAITAAQLAPNSVGASQLASGAVGSTQIGANAVGASQLASDPASLSRVSNGLMTSAGGTLAFGTTPTVNFIEVTGGSATSRVVNFIGATGADAALAAGPPSDTVAAGELLLGCVDGSTTATAATGPDGGDVRVLAARGARGTSQHGRGGDVRIDSGNGGGNPSSAAAGGNGGSLVLSAGSGGASSNVAGDGGEVTIQGGLGGNGSFGGAGGSVFIIGGSGGVDPDGYIEMAGSYVRASAPLGVNTTPLRPLHVRANGASGVTPSTNAFAVIENNSTNYLALLTPDASEKGINFGSPASAVHGGIYYTNASGMSLRTGNNSTAMLIDASGNVGIGGSTTGANLRVTGASPVKFVLSPTTADTNTEMMFSENASLSNGIKLQMDGSTNALSVTDVTSGAESNIATFDRDGNTFAAGSKAFRIDHPLDPLNKELWHSCVESPDMLNVYSGNVATGSDGTATIELPAYFEALNKDFRYQLTVLDEDDQPEVLLWAKVTKKIRDNRFTIRTSRPGVEVSWQITGVRKDALAETHRIVVERDKPAAKKGTYLHPEAFKAATNAVGGDK
ncbi:MAG: hypothetical protein QM783_01770 [Phycisphaerales bacterium]